MIWDNHIVYTICMASRPTRPPAPIGTILTHIVITLPGGSLRSA